VGHENHNLLAVNSGNTLKGPIWLALIMIAEVCGWIFTGSEVLRAFSVAGVASVVIFILLGIKLLEGKMTISSNSMAGWRLLSPVVLLCVYGLVIGIYKENKTYYVYADVYHLLIELVLLSLLTIWAFKDRSPLYVLKTLAFTAVILGLLGITGSVLGTLGYLTSGGHFVESLGAWRLKAGRGFPEFLLILITASFSFRGDIPRTIRHLRFSALLILLINLVLVLRRSMWISYSLSLLILFLPRHTIRVLVIFTILLLPCLIIFSVLFPGTTQSLLLFLGELLTYNPNYTVADTLLERFQQLSSVLVYLTKNSWGYGFGAEFFTYWTRGNEYGLVHYIHNLYVYYFLQLGFVGCTIFLIPLMVVPSRLWKNMAIHPSYEWLSRGCLAGLAALLVNGLVMVSTHTVFAGLILGLSIYCINSNRQPAV
jgi:hypothetical protein